MEIKNEKQINKNKNNNNFIRSLFHHLILLYLILICIWDRIENVPKFPYNFLYLTQIDLYINIIYYFLICLKEQKKEKNLKKSYEKFFNFCFSFSFNAFIMFWLIFINNKKNLFKIKIKFSFFLIFNLHGGIFLINLIEAIFLNKRNKPKTINLFFYFFFAVIYPFFLRFIYFKFGIKSYPFITKNFFLVFGIVFISLLMCLIGHFIYVFISKEKEEEKENNEKKEELIEINNEN